MVDRCAIQRLGLIVALLSVVACGGGGASGGEGGTDADTRTDAGSTAPPLAADDDATVTEDGSITLNVLANDQYGSGGSVGAEVAVVDPAGHGSVTLLDGGTPHEAADDRLRYEPDADFNGEDRFRYRLSGPNGDTSTALVRVTVVAVNDPPTFSIGPDQEVLPDVGEVIVARWATELSPGPENESTQSVVAFEVEAVEPGLFATGPTVDADGTLSFTPASGTRGATRVRIAAIDDAGTGNGGVDTSTAASFAITVGNPPGTNQALLGPLSGAQIRAFTLSDLENPVEGPVLAGISEDDRLVAGTFELGLPGVGDDEWVLVTASGGSDIDADDDGRIDGVPVPNAGTLHAIARAEEWREGGLSVNVLTEIAWRQVESLVRNGRRGELGEALDFAATGLLRDDLSGDRAVDVNDLTAFRPARQADRRSLTLSTTEFGLLTEALQGGSQSEVGRQIDELFGVSLVDSDRRVVGRAVLEGPLRAARIELFDTTTPSAPPLYEGRTLEASSEDAAGAFTLPADLFEPGGLYVLRVRGGVELPPAGDASVEELPFEGTLHAFLAGGRARRGDLWVSGLTEAAYQNSVNLISTGAPRSVLAQRLDDSARNILKGDVDLDGAVDREDLVAFSPSADSALISTGPAPRRRTTGLDYEGLAALIRGQDPDFQDLANFASPVSSVLKNTRLPYRGFQSLDAVTDGAFAYVAGVRGRLLVIDISQPDQASVVGAVEFEGTSSAGFQSGIAVSGGTAAVSFGFFSDDDGVQLIDVRDSASPVLAGRIASIGDPQGMDFVGDYLYVLDDEGLKVFEISNPDAPVLRSATSLPGGGFNVQIHDRRAYVAGQGTLNVFDVTVPDSPSLLGSVGFPASDFVGFVDMAVDGSRVFLNSDSVVVVDASDPQQMTVTDVAIPGLADLDFDDGLLFGAGARGLAVIDVTAGGELALRRWMPGGSGVVSVKGEVAVTAGSPASGIELVDIGGGSNPFLVAAERSRFGGGLTVAGEQLIADTGSLTVFDVTQPDAPTLLGETPAPSPGDVSGSSGSEIAYDPSTDRAYTIRFDWLVAWDLANRSNPQVLSTFELDPGAGPVTALEVLDGTVFVRTASSLELVDVSTPTQPVLLGRLAGLPGGGIAVRDRVVYITGPEELAVIDVAVPSSPEVVSTLPIEARPAALAVTGEHLLAASSVLEIFRIAEPLAPEKVGELFPRAFFLGGGPLVIEGDIAYLGRNAVDIADPSAPELIGSVLGRIQGVRDQVLLGERLYVGTGSAGIEVARSVQVPRRDLSFD